MNDPNQTEFILRSDEGTDSLIGRSLLDRAIELPRLVLESAALDSNIAVMNGWCESAGVSLAPHTKTTWAPWIIRRQLASGIWGVTVATLSQLRSCLEIGAKRIILAHQLVNPAGAAWLGRILASIPDTEVYCLVDSVAGASALSRGWDEAGNERPLAVLLELGVPGGRTGCRTASEMLAVAQGVAAQDQLILSGVEGFEGVLGRSRSEAELATVDQFLGAMVAIARQLDQEGLFDETPEILLTAGGSLYFDRVAEILGACTLSRPTRTVLRSGGYVTHDHGDNYEPVAIAGPSGTNRLTPALQLWSDVVSVPEPGLAIAALGKREAPFDVGLPPVLARVPIGRTDIESCTYPVVTRLNDQHAFLDTSAGPALEVGDRVICGVVHPCTAFDKWRTVLVVDQDHVVQETFSTCF